MSYSLGYTYSLNSNAGANSASGAIGRIIYEKDQIFALNINIPLSKFLPSTWAGYSLNTSKNGNTTNSISMSGTALQNDALSWGIQEGYSSQGTGNTGSLNATYKGTYGELNTGYSYDRDTQCMNYGLSGGVIAHANGITLSQPPNETVALVKALGAGGVSILNQAGAKTDFRGYAIVGNMSP